MRNVDQFLQSPHGSEPCPPPPPRRSHIPRRKTTDRIGFRLTLPKLFIYSSHIKRIVKNNIIMTCSKYMYREENRPSVTCILYTAVLTKVVQKKHKSVPIHFVSFNTCKQVFIAPPSNVLKICELDDVTVNNHNPSCLSVLSHTL